MIDRRHILYFDWTLLGITMGMLVLGIINLYSASYQFGSGTPIFLKQILYIVAGLFMILVILQFKCVNYERYAYWLFFFSLILLVSVFFIGKVGGGARRWIAIGGFTYQPSELTKITMILALAKYFHNRNNIGGYYLKELIIPLLILAVPFLMVMKQPDLGTALIHMAVFVSMVLFVKVRFKSILLVAGSGMAAAPVLWHLLKDYQKKRLLTFLNPESDPLGSGYHIIQSKIAVGSGRLFGRGYLSGTQSQLEFLPEHHTDFIFSVLAEEWGFIGCLLVISLFVILVLWGIGVVKEGKTRFEMVMSFGIVSLITWHFVINIGMVVGLLPVVGVPLPFFSYGGSFMLTQLIGIGFLLNLRMRRFE